MAVPDEIVERPTGREPVVVLTAPWSPEPRDVLLWFEDRRAIVVGDSLADFGRGLEIQREWLRQGETREEVAAGLRPLLDRPVEVVLTAHGSPTDRAALERALS